MPIPSALDEIASVTVRLYGDGQMGIEGNVGDVALATTMLEQAIAAVKDQWSKRSVSGGLLGDVKPILVPDYDVDRPSHHPDFPVIPKGDMT